MYRECYNVCALCLSIWYIHLDVHSILPASTFGMTMVSLRSLACVCWFCTAVLLPSANKLLVSLFPDSNMCTCGQHHVAIIHPLFSIKITPYTGLIAIIIMSISIGAPEDVEGILR